MNHLRNNQENKLPFVSVIVPVYNDKDRIGTCIGALLNQTYPPEAFEIIIVDNGSNEGTVDVIKQFPVHLEFETKVQSSYAARNRGLQGAKGEIIAFTDSDCTPVKEWVTEGVKALQSNNADLASGNVRFTFSPQKTGAETYDSLVNMQIERNIADRKVSKTANLFVRAEVFRQIGMFPLVKSGGDVLWTGLATKNGFKLVYNRFAEVAHPTRKLLALIKKQYRVGKGQPAIMSTSGHSISKNMLTIVSKISPRKLISVARWLKKQSIDLTLNQTAKVCIAAYLCSVATFCGNMASVQHLWKE